MVCGDAGLLHANRKEVGKTERHRFREARTLDEVHWFLVLRSRELQATILGGKELLAAECVDSTMRHDNVRFPNVFSFHFGFVRWFLVGIPTSPADDGQAATHSHPPKRMRCAGARSQTNTELPQDAAQVEQNPRRPMQDAA
jgi:hypothetical protein